MSKFKLEISQDFNTKFPNGVIKASPKILQISAVYFLYSGIIYINLLGKEIYIVDLYCGACHLQVTTRFSLHAQSGPPSSATHAFVVNGKISLPTVL